MWCILMNNIDLKMLSVVSNTYPQQAREATNIIKTIIEPRYSM